ncbi:uncharacterized protein ACO6RY_19267 [Pungitius sinensis]
MSYKQRKDQLTQFLLIVTVYMYTFEVSHSVSLGQRAEGHELTASGEMKRDNDWHPRERVSQSPNPRTTERPSLPELRPEVAAPPTAAPHRSWPWTVGNIRAEPRSSAPDSEEGYQADFTGVHGVQGKVLGPSFDSSSHVSEWLAMSPGVQCDDGVMTFTASGKEFKHLFVDREEASPISLFNLPQNCRYSVRTSPSDFEMMVPYDACYITQENGSYVLPMLWWGVPLKLSCPVQASTLDPPVSDAALSVLCSSYGMAVQITREELDVEILGVIVNDRWGPFVSEDCAYSFPSHPGQRHFFIPFGAQCITKGKGSRLHLTSDDHEYILSCPVHPQFPYAPFPPSPPPTQEEAVNVLDIPFYPSSGFRYPQVNPTRPQPAVERATSSPDITPVTGSPHTLPELPVGSSQYAPGWYYPNLPVYYPTEKPAATSAAEQAAATTTVPPATPSYHPYYYEIPPYPAAPGPPEPSSPLTPPPSPPSPPEQPLGPQNPGHDAFHPPASYGSHYHYHPALEVRPASPSHPTSSPPSLPPPTIAQHYSPSDPFGHFPAGTPISPPVLTSPEPANERVAPQANCPYPHTHPNYPYYHPPGHPPHQALPWYPVNQPPVHTTTITPTTSSTAGPTPPLPQLQCVDGRMDVFLPFAQPDTLQVKDQTKTWLFVPDVSPVCGFTLETAEGYGVILHSPLPACYSQLLTPTTVSLLLRFWDLSVGQYRSLELRCPYQPAHDTPVPATPPLSPSNGNVGATVVPKPKVLCSSHQMTVELPSSSVSGIVIKDIKGNQMSLQDAPRHCGYSARKGKDGQIHLIIQLHSRCHMSVQGQMFIITVVYVTVNGRREAQFSCPVVIPGSGQECNLPSEQRLPCGPGSVSHSQCLSMGCCSSNNPPACYYPMDECTIDRHFVFSVPASLTEPPLSPDLLVVAGNSTCKPQRVTPEYALFNIPMDGCGTRRVTVGDAVIYMVEVINKVPTLSLNYGTITRDSSVRLLVECRFLPGTISVSYMVKTPTLGPNVPAQGMFGVQLRLAKDAQYSSYYPQNHPPLQMLLGKPLYLEVRLLNAPDPSLVLLVHFCVAYPLSGKAVWLLLYNGCPNPYDPALEQAVLSDTRPSTPPAQTRRFTISTFQFLPDGAFRDPNEENNFMCSTEICSPRDGPCVEGCFGQ